MSVEKKIEGEVSQCERGAGHQRAANGAVKKNNSNKRLHKDLRSSRPQWRQRENRRHYFPFSSFKNGCSSLLMQMAQVFS